VNTTEVNGKENEMQIIEDGYGGNNDPMEGHSMKIVVYFENGRASNVEAQFASEELYAACLPALEDFASKGGYIVTESCREDEEVTDEEDEVEDE
jgi:hypothetical protein